MNKKGRTFWMTGLSGSGKTTLANLLQKENKINDNPIIILDGDILRSGICSDLGFSLEDRFKQNQRAAHLAKILNNQGFTVICALISPTEKIRNEVKEIIGADNFYLIYIDCPLQICQKRDVKGLYKKNEKEGVLNLSGISQEFQIPEKYWLHVETSIESINTSLCKLQVAIQDVGKS